MLMRAITQMFSDVVWKELDVLVLDMPPGTGDAQLSIAQSVPVGAGVAVTTPQLVSLDDGARALDMFQKLFNPNCWYCRKYEQPYLCKLWQRARYFWQRHHASFGAEIQYHNPCKNPPRSCSARRRR